MTSENFPLLLKAISFAARVHQGQFRKDGRTPYASHPFRVCLTLRHVFGVDDERLLAAAALHDVIEDTTTDFDDVEKHFGRDVAQWVAYMSKDMRLPESLRENAYRAQLRKAPDAVKLLKLADLHDNLLDVAPEQRARTVSKAQAHLKNLKAGTKNKAVRRAIQIVEKIAGK